MRLFYLILISCIPFIHVHAQEVDHKEGKLKSGIKYYTLSTPHIKGKTTIGMIVKTGAYFETQEEIGIAHYLEHLCASSVAGYSADSLLKVVFDGGMDLFSDYAAFTSENRTVYNYTYPTQNKDTEAAFLSYLAGVISEMKFSKENVEKERQIIYKEMQSSFSGKKSWLKGTYFENHSILGDSTTLKRVSPELVDQFYRKWYRPDNIAFVVVGDRSAKELEQVLSHYLDEQECIVQDSTPTPYLPKDVFTVGFGNFKESHGKKYQGCVTFYHDSRAYNDASQREEGLALELVARIFRGVLEGESYQGNGFKITYAPTSTPRAGGLRVVFQANDSIQWVNKLKQIGQLTNWLMNNEVDEYTLAQMKQGYKSPRAFDVVNHRSSDHRIIVNQLYKLYERDMPILPSDEWSDTLNQSLLGVKVNQVKSAAQELFEDFNIFQTNFKITSNEDSIQLCQHLTSPETMQEEPIFLLPGNIKIAPRLDPRRKLIEFKARDLNRGAYTYDPQKGYFTLSNGMTVLYEPKSENNKVSILCARGYLSADEKAQPYLAQEVEFATPLLDDLSYREAGNYYRAWGNASPRIKVSAMSTEVSVMCNSGNETYVWPLISELFHKHQISKEELDLMAKRRKSKKTSHYDKYSGLMLGRASFDVENIYQPSAEELTHITNLLLAPQDAIVKIEGEVDLHNALQTLASLPNKKLSKEYKVDYYKPRDDKFLPNENLRGNTYVVNRMYRQELKKATIKDYLLMGMLEEYMHRRMNLVIREELGLVYSWGVTRYVIPNTLPLSAISLRFRIVPELQEQGIAALDSLCQLAIKEGIDARNFKGLCRREWNRHLTQLNNPKDKLAYQQFQIRYSDRLWTDNEVRECLETLTNEELNTFVKSYFSQNHITLVK